ncbi:MAG: AAA family ATPase [Thermoguttaceae bacterium]|nr:AAA family ATPase [Thermoguttaceae bacterium]
MRLTKITIENYRAITAATIDVDAKTTLIVGRNNTAKTSVGAFIQTGTSEKRARRARRGLSLTTIIRWRN